MWISAPIKLEKPEIGWASGSVCSSSGQGRQSCVSEWLLSRWLGGCQMHQVDTSFSTYRRVRVSSPPHLTQVLKLALIGQVYVSAPPWIHSSVKAGGVHDCPTWGLHEHLTRRFRFLTGRQARRKRDHRLWEAVNYSHCKKKKKKSTLLITATK